MCQVKLIFVGVGVGPNHSHPDHPSPRRKMTGMERYEYIHNRLCFFTSHIVEAKLSAIKVRVRPYLNHHFPKHRTEKKTKTTTVDTLIITVRRFSREIQLLSFVNCDFNCRSRSRSKSQSPRPSKSKKKDDRYGTL